MLRQPPRERAAGWRGMLAPAAQATLVFLLVNLLLVLAMTFNDTPVFDQGSYLRYDSGHYVSIAAGGYELFPCDGREFPAGAWCGNTGWFPGYPYLMRLVRPYTGRHFAVAGIVLSKAFLLGTLLLLAYAARPLADPARAFALVLAAGVFPGGVYYHAVFPISQFLFFATLHILLLSKRRDLLAGIAGALAAASYSNGYLLAGVSGVYLLLTYESLRVLVRRSLLVPGVTLLGVAAVLAIHHQSVGAWNAWFLVQSKYGWQPLQPVATFAQILSPRYKNGPDTVVAIQNLVVAALMIVALAEAVRHRGRDPATMLPLVYACIFFFVPVLVVGPRLSYHRAFSLLMPAMLLSARWPTALLVTFAVVFGALFPLVAVLFFNSAIV